MDLAINNQQCLLCHKTKPNQTTGVKFLDQLVTVVRSTAPLTESQQMVLVASAALWPSWNLISMSS